MKARNRPPRLERRAPSRAAVPAPTTIELLDRARITGKVASPGPRELRHLVERVQANPVETWSAVRAIFGATADEPQIDAECTVRAARLAAARIGAVARARGRILFATADPASLLGVHGALARLARGTGAVIDDSDDSGPLRIDGRAPRWFRWLDRVAVVTDGAALISTKSTDAGDELLFLAGRPVLVVADGAFAAAAVAAGLEVVAFAGLERVEFAIPAARDTGCLVVPVHVGRPPRAYAPLVSLLEASFFDAAAGESAELEID
jgi:hypothetical protein